MKVITAQEALASLGPQKPRTPQRQKELEARLLEDIFRESPNHIAKYLIARLDAITSDDAVKSQISELLLSLLYENGDTFNEETFGDVSSEYLERTELRIITRAKAALQGKTLMDGNSVCTVGYLLHEDDELNRVFVYSKEAEESLIADIESLPTVATLDEWFVVWNRAYALDDMVTMTNKQRLRRTIKRGGVR